MQLAGVARRFRVLAVVLAVTSFLSLLLVTMGNDNGEERRITIRAPREAAQRSAPEARAGDAESNVAPSPASSPLSPLAPLPRLSDDDAESADQPQSTVPVVSAAAATTAPVAALARPVGGAADMLAFSASPAGHPAEEDVHLVNGDGTNLRRLLNPGARDFPGPWSPDGTRLAMTQSEGGVNPQGLVVDDDGTIVAGFATNGGGYSWSPDGTKIVSVTWLGLTTTVVAANPSAQVIVPATQGMTMASPLWAPAGDTIAYLCGTAAQGLCIVGTDGSGRHLLSADLVVNAMAWAPDGSRIVFFGAEEVSGGTSSAMYSIRPDGTDLRIVAAGVRGYALAWSPDGKTIAFAGDDVGTVPSAGGHLAVLVPGAAAQSVAWSPSGARIAYVSIGFVASTAGVFTMARDGSDRGRVDDRTLESPWAVSYRPIR